ncbi:MAG: hypothetical protein Phog2KO_33850 [Phototrophicaceae bacterium]
MSNYLFIDQDIDKLREDIHHTKFAVYKRLYDQCQRYANESLSEEMPSGSITFMGIASANLSLMYLLTKQAHYLEEAKRWIFTCVNYPHWGSDKNRDVDLSAAWLLFGLGLSYNWLKSALTEDERRQFRDKLILQATRMYEYKEMNPESGWVAHYWQNHNWINIAGLATTAYALVNEYPEAQNWIDASKENFEFVYSVLADDGSDYEGVVYWRYGAMWLFVYAHLIKEREGIDYFATTPFLKNTFYYRLYQSAPDLQRQINFGDCHDRFSGHSTAIYYKTAAEYRNGHAQKLGNLVRDDFLYREAMESKVKPGILPECLFEVLFYDPSVPETDFDDLPLTAYFEDLGLAVIRSSWEEDATHFSFKCSAPGGKTQWDEAWKLIEQTGYKHLSLSHQHPDNNSFILVANDTYFAIDDGYNRHVKAEHHNVVLVDGVGYQDEGKNDIWSDYTPDMTGVVEKYVNEEGLVYVVGETAKTYQKSLKMTRVARHVLYAHRPYFIIFDELRSELDHEYTWLLHSDVFPCRDDNVFFYQNGPATMWIHSVFPDAVTATMEDKVVRAVMTSQEPDNFCQTKLKTLALKTRTKAKSAYFLNVIALGNVANDSELIVTPIQNNTTIGVQVQDGDQIDVFLYSPEGCITFEGREYSAQELYLLMKGNQVIKEVAL